MTTPLHQSVADLAETVAILMGVLNNHSKTFEVLAARLDVVAEASRARTERISALEARVSELEGTLATLTIMINALRSALGTVAPK